MDSADGEDFDYSRPPYYIEKLREIHETE
jgi:DNA replicative helicase MCM subunit Mcm2 (Cdc46/Mcm family)